MKKIKRYKKFNYDDGTMIIFDRLLDGMILAFPSNKFNDTTCKFKVDNIDCFVVRFSSKDIKYMLKCMLKRDKAI